MVASGAGDLKPVATGAGDLKLVATGAGDSLTMLGAIQARLSDLLAGLAQTARPLSLGEIIEMERVDSLSWLICNLWPGPR